MIIIWWTGIVRCQEICWHVGGNVHDQFMYEPAHMHRTSNWSKESKAVTAIVCETSNIVSVILHFRWYIILSQILHIPNNPNHSQKTPHSAPGRAILGQNVNKLYHYRYRSLFNIVIYSTPICREFTVISHRESLLIIHFLVLDGYICLFC